MQNMKEPIQSVNNSVLKQNIRNLIDREGITQTELAKRIGMSQPNMNKRLSLSNDSNRFTLDHVWAIADYFDVSVDDLLGRKPKSQCSSLRKICSDIVNLFESHQIRYTKIERDETYEKVEYNGVTGYPDSTSIPTHVSYNAIYFHNYFYREDSNNEMEFIENCNVIEQAGNDIRSNIKINDFLNHFIEAFERHEKGEYPDEVYEILVKTYLDTLVK